MNGRSGCLTGVVNLQKFPRHTDDVAAPDNFPPVSFLILRTIPQEADWSLAQEIPASRPRPML